ncbi:MAG: ABC transporter substrate-binding protein [Deltaproteobacteria bacterium]|nr:ABC transporter substrate-binding protein [Deltaproteobacteria bacterium]
MRDIVIILSMLLTILGCSKDEQDASFSKEHLSNYKETIKIGVYLPMTGPLADYGKRQWDGICVAHKIRPAVKDKKIDLILKDTKGDKEKAARVVSDLINQYEASGIIGGATKNEALGASSVAEAAKIPMIISTATEAIITKDRGYVWRVCFTDIDQSKVAARFAIDELHAKRAALIIDECQDHSVKLANYFSAEFIKHGGRIVDDVYIKTGDTKFSAQMTSIKQNLPDIIYCPNYYKEDALIIKCARKFNIKTPFIVSHIIQEKRFLDIGGKALKDVYLITHLHRDAICCPLAKSFIKLYEENTGRRIDAASALAADAYFMLTDALETSHTLKAPDIKNIMESIKDKDYVSGKITITSSGKLLRPIIISTPIGRGWTKLRLVTSLYPSD